MKMCTSSNDDVHIRDVPNPQSLRDSPLQGAYGPARTGRLCRLVIIER